MLSQRAKTLKPSPTLAMSQKAKELQASGCDVVNLTVGEPDWPTFSKISQVGIEAIQSGFTKYTAAAGTVELRQEIANDTNRWIGTNYKASDCVVGAGAKYVIYAALQMLVNPGDEVIIPAPYWVSYPAMVDLAGGKNVFISTSLETRFKLTVQDLERAITPKSKVLILCSPSNPTGIEYTKTELSALAAVIAKHPQLMVISDDIYNRLTFSGSDVAPHILQVAPELKKQMFVVNGVSKTYSMTGWRLGWGLGPQELIPALSDYLSQTTSNVSSISQKAAQFALKNCDEDVMQAREQLKKRLQLITDGLRDVPGLKVIPPDGAFYIWADVNGWLNKTYKKTGTKISSSKVVAELLLEQTYLATVPGIEFGTEGFLRLSFAASEAQLKKAIDRLKQFATDCA